jgi:hypothetical protein
MFYICENGKQGFNTKLKKERLTTQGQENVLIIPVKKTG